MTSDRHMPLRRTGRTGRTGQASSSSRPDPSSEPITEVLKDLLEELQSLKVPTRPPRDWIQIFVTALPGLAAAAALFFTWQSINATTDATNHQLNATNRQLQIAEQGQVTDRYNAAITNLGSSSVDVRLGGIYALQRIMQDSPRDQPTVVAVLCAFVRDQALPSVKPPSSRLRTDIQAALTVVFTRNTKNDGPSITINRFVPTTVVDLDHAQLANGQFSALDLSGADFTGANLAGAQLARANLFEAYLAGANLTGANLVRANFDDANLAGANLTDADLTSSHGLGSFNLVGANLTGAKGLPPGIP
jgi:uncharacterized protein YjbI with pentapeptide repeats